jgi:hypothetical protein
MSYIIIVLVTFAIGTSGSTWYYKDAYEKEALLTLEYMRAAESLRAFNERIQEDNKRRVETINEEYKRHTDSLRADVTRLRKQTSSSILPETTNPRSAEIAFNKQRLDKAIQGFRGEIQELVVRGAKCELELNLAKEWAADVQ